MEMSLFLIMYVWIFVVGPLVIYALLKGKHITLVDHILVGIAIAFLLVLLIQGLVLLAG